MAEQRRRLVRLAVLEELRASYGIKVKSGSCLAAAKQPGAEAAEVRGAVASPALTEGARSTGRAAAGWGARWLPLRERSPRGCGSWSPAPVRPGGRRFRQQGRYRNAVAPASL